MAALHWPDDRQGAAEIYMSKLVWLTLSVASLVSNPASAAALSFEGSLDPTNPNDVFLMTFTLASQANMVIRTWGYGGTAGAPFGTNAAGAVVAAGGFDPYVSLFTGSGVLATFLASNDDGVCPPGTASPACADSTLSVANLAAGTYTLALTLPFNFSFAENLGTGSLGDGFIGLDSGYSDGTCVGLCTNQYAVDITSAGIVPEPTTSSLLLAGLSGVAALTRRRRT
jgi:hypothetical protein